MKLLYGFVPMVIKLYWLVVGSSSEDALLKFKRSFYRRELNGFHIGKKIYNVR